MSLVMALIVAFAQVQFGPARAQGTAIISGRVLGTDGRPVINADVLARGIGRGIFNTRVTTDADGHYELTGLLAGRYRVEVSKEGFLTVEYGQQRPLEDGAIVTVLDGQRLDDIDVVLAKHSAIVGHVYDEAGDPVEGASVRVSQIVFVDGRRALVGVPGVDSRLTDDRGQFRVFGLAPGQYLVSALVGQIEFPGPGMLDMPGYAPTFYPGSASPAGATLVDVGLSTDVRGVDFSLVPAPTAHVYGQAVSAAGDPITGNLTMRSSQRSGGVLSEVGAIINPDGTFIFPNVAPGEYAIQVARQRVNGWTEGEFASQIVEVNGADVRDVGLRTSAGSELTGRITIPDPSGVSPGDVEMTPVPADRDNAPAESGEIAHAEIKDDWTFALAGLHGPRLLRLTQAPAGWFLKAVLVDGRDVTDDPMPFGLPRQSVHDVEVVLSQTGAEIAGAVPDPTAQGSVIVFPTDRSQWRSDSRFLKMTALKDGAFDVVGLPSADYYVAAVTRLSGDEWQDPILLDQLASSAVQVFASEGQKVSAAPKLIAR